MDLSDSPEETAFRDTVRAWLAANLPAELRDKVVAYDHLSRDDLLLWHRILADQGWIAPSWPKEWGGTDWTAVQRYIFEEECGYAGAPPLIPYADWIFCLVRNDWLSLDPYMRGRMSEAKSYATPVAIRGLMVGQTVGEVIESRDPRFKPGDRVLTSLGWQLNGVAKADTLTPIDAAHFPASYYLGVLGMPGFTAWFGLSEIGKPKAGETFVVSAASGAVGGVAGRIEEDLMAACANGADIYFDNVGGPILDAMLAIMTPFSRIIVCGTISDHGAKQPYGYRNLRSVLVNRIRMQGMLVYDWKERNAEALAGLSRLLAEGRLRYRESIAEGLDIAPQAFVSMLGGGNFGKQLVRLP